MTVSIIGVGIGVAVVVYAVITNGLRRRWRAAIGRTITLIFAWLADCVAAAWTGRIGIAIHIIAVRVGVAVIIDAVITSGLRRRRRAAIGRTITLIFAYTGFADCVAAAWTGRISIAIHISAVCVGVAVIVYAVITSGLR